MPEKDPSNYSMLTYAWVAALSIMGGLVSHLNKLNNGAPFSVLRFVADILTAAFTGIVTFYLCQSAELDNTLTAAFVAISGHMGSRILFVLESKLKKRLDSIL